MILEIQVQEEGKELMFSKIEVQEEYGTMESYDEISIKIRILFILY